MEANLPPAIYKEVAPSMFKANSASPLADRNELAAIFSELRRKIPEHFWPSGSFDVLDQFRDSQQILQDQEAEAASSRRTLNKRITNNNRNNKITVSFLTSDNQNESTSNVIFVDVDA